MLFTLADKRVMFLDLGVARKVEDLGVNVREKFFVCMPPGGNKDAEWNVWRSPETEKAAIEVTAQPEFASAEESPLEQKLRESIELVKQGKLGELGNGTFAVPAGASAGTPAPVQSGASNRHQTLNNGHGSTNGKNGNGAPKHSEQSGPPVWAQSLLEQANALVDVYAAALNSASTETRQPGKTRGRAVTVRDGVHSALESGVLWSLTYGLLSGCYGNPIWSGSRRERGGYCGARLGIPLIGPGFGHCLVRSARTVANRSRAYRLRRGNVDETFGLLMYSALQELPYHRERSIPPNWKADLREDLRH